MNSNYYLYSSNYFWTLTPGIFLSYRSHANNFSVNSAGSFEATNSVGGTYVTRPVINLKSDVIISKGDGSSINPFVVKAEG